MPKLVKLDSVTNDDWTIISETIEFAAIKDKTLVNIETYGANFESLSGREVGVWISSDIDVMDLPFALNNLKVVALRFESFMDGRSFSQARSLRDHLEFDGELRAVGNFIQDQLFYLRRCGFSEFSVPDDANIESLQESLQDFSDSYQAACDVPQPLFRRRA